MEKVKIKLDYTLFYRMMSLMFLLIAVVFYNNRDIGMIGVLLYVALLLFLHWFDRNWECKQQVLHQLLELAIKSEENYQENGDHFLYSAKSLIGRLEGTQQDLALAITDIAKNEGFSFLYRQGEKLTSKMTEIYIYETHPFRVEFRSLDSDEVVPLEELVFAFDDDMAAEYHRKAREGKYLPYSKRTNK